MIYLKTGYHRLVKCVSNVCTISAVGVEPCQMFKKSPDVSAYIAFAIFRVNI
jgi:hypothetical protein